MTERKAIVKHFVDNDVKVGSPIDVSVYLVRDQQRPDPELADQKDYVDKVLKAGYTSKMACGLFNDIVGAIKKAEKTEQ